VGSNVEATVQLSGACSNPRDAARVERALAGLSALPSHLEDEALPARPLLRRHRSGGTHQRRSLACRAIRQSASDPAQFGSSMYAGALTE
jgi:hypothetical protein